MAETIKSLQQLSPSATTLSALYTCPSSTQAVISSLIVCNQNSSTVHFRISVAINGAADNVKQYLYYDMPLFKNDTFAATLGVTLNAGDVVRVYTDTTNVSFNMALVEIS